MILKKYNIELHRLESEDIELIRVWRNDPKITRHMFFDKPITPSMQSEWFEKTNTIHHHFFKIVFSGKAVGLIHISDIDFEKRDAFSGLFIYEDTYLATDVPARASLCMLDYFFEENILFTVYAKTKKENGVALKYNQSLGFEKAGSIEGEEGDLLRLTRENYFFKCRPFKTFFGKSPLKICYNDALQIDTDWQRHLRDME